MGCSACGRGGAGARQAARQSGIAAAKSIAAGLTPVNPIILGDEVPEQEPIKARVLAPYPKLTEGASPWVAGSLVEQLVDDGVLHDTKLVAQSGRVWRVGAKNYLDYDTALRVAQALGTTPKEIA